METTLYIKRLNGEEIAIPLSDKVLFIRIDKGYNSIESGWGIEKFIQALGLQSLAEFHLPRS